MFVPNLIDCIWKVPKKEEAYFWSFNQKSKKNFPSFLTVLSLKKLFRKKRKRKNITHPNAHNHISHLKFRCTELESNEEVKSELQTNDEYNINLGGCLC